MIVAVVSYRTCLVSKPNLVNTASILLNPSIDLELCTLLNTET